MLFELVLQQFVDVVVVYLLLEDLCELCVISENVLLQLQGVLQLVVYVVEYIVIVCDGQVLEFCFYML